MRIGLLTTSFPRREDDVPGQFVLGFARALARRGHVLRVLAPEPHEASYQAPPTFPGIEVRWVRYMAPRSLERTFYGAGVLDNVAQDPIAALGLIPFVPALARAAESSLADCDALVSHWAVPSGLVAGALRKGRPHLAVLHSADVFLLERLPFRRVLASRIARSADALVLASRDLRERFLALLDPVVRSEAAQHAHVCAMGIEPATVPKEGRATLRKRLALDRFTLLSLGRLIELKGLEHAIEACARVEGVTLVIAGAGPARARLEGLARSLGAPVRFVGEVHGDQKAAWLEAADALVLPSIKLPSGRTEGMPTVLLEAMEHGLPVIASDVGGVRDVVRPGENGLVVPPGDAEALADALRTLVSTRSLTSFQQDARATAAMYHWDALAPRFEALLEPSKARSW